MHEITKIESDSGEALSVKAADGARLVLLAVGDDVHAITPKEARKLAAALIEAANVHG